MKKEYLKNLVGEGKTLKELSEATGKGQTTVVYWMKKYDLKTSNAEKGHATTAFVCLCGEDDEAKFYKSTPSMCKQCHGEYCVERYAKVKKKAVEYKGGSCENCGYDRHNGCLEFHHLDPTQKDPNFAYSRGWAWERLAKELDKCVMLCANCHREVHGGVLKL